MVNTHNLYNTINKYDECYENTRKEKIYNDIFYSINKSQNEII